MSESKEGNLDPEVLELYEKVQAKCAAIKQLLDLKRSKTVTTLEDYTALLMEHYKRKLQVPTSNPTGDV